MSIQQRVQEHRNREVLRERAEELVARIWGSEHPARVPEALVEFAATEIEARRAALDDAMVRHRKRVEADLRMKALLIDDLRQKILAQRDIVELMRKHGQEIRALRSDVDRLSQARSSWLRRVIRSAR